ncbi:RpiR family transcriptional regulator, partial [Listeria monocytogenes]|nr:RpiR family transcriptional regulator [Listeria monocytogenes]
EMYQEANITSQLPALYTIENIAREIRTQIDKEKM